MRLTRLRIVFATGAPALALGVVFGLASAAHAQFGTRGVPVGEDGIITRANLDPNEAWPLTIERATFVCDGEAVFLSDGTTQYPLNGVAKTLTATHPEHRRPLEEIWRRDDTATQGLKDAGQPIEVVRVNITPLLSRGTQWCRKR